MVRSCFRSLLLLLLLASSSHAATYWVSTASTGDGNNGCNASSTPLTTTAKRTIDAGWNCLAPGDTLMVRGGTYAGLNFNNSRGGASGSPKTLKPAVGETVVLDAALTTHNGGGVITFWGLGANYITLDGSGGVLKITDSVTGPPDHNFLQPQSWPCQNLWTNVNGVCNGLTPGTDSGTNIPCAQSIYNFVSARRRGLEFDYLSTITNRPHHVRVLNVELTRLGQFALWGNVDDLEVFNSHIHNNDLYGSYISGFRHWWHNNHVHDNRTIGLRFGSDGNPGDPVEGKMANGTIENNLIHDNYGRIFHVSGNANDSDLETGGFGIVCYGCSNNLIKNNVVYNNAWNDRWGNTCIIWGIYTMDRLTGQNQVFNNTIVGHTTTSATPADGVINAAFGGQNTIYRNNIIYGNKNNVEPGTNSVFSTNLCNNADTGCTIPNANPLFTNPSAGDYKISVATSPAVGVGLPLIGVPADAEGVPRSSTPTVGAYEFVASGPVNPDPELLLAYWALDEGTSLTAADGSGHGNTGTLDTAAWVSPGIIGASAFAPTGTQEVTIPSSLGLGVTSSCSINAWIRMTTMDTLGSGIFSNREGCSLYLSQAGEPECWVRTTVNWTNARGPASVLTGTNRMLTCTYDSGEVGSGIRISVDDAQVAFTPLTGSIRYDLANSAIRIGRDGADFSGFQSRGVIDEVRLYQGRLSDTGRHNLFNAFVPQLGLSVTHQASYAADAAEGMQLGTTDADYQHIITQPIGLRWAIHKADLGSLTEYFPIYCRTDTGTGFGPWTVVGNTLGALGVRYYADSVVTQGQATTRLLPLDGFTGIAGKFLENPVTVPSDATQRMTIAQGEQAEVQAQVAFGAPLGPGAQVQCLPYRENGTPFTSYLGVTP